MRSATTLIGSRVARRLLMLFALSALLPIFAIGVFSVGKVQTTLSEQTAAELTQAGKAYGMGALDRLVWVEDMLDDVARTSTGDPSSLGRLVDRIDKEIQGFLVVDAEQRPLSRAGAAFQLPLLSEAARRRVASGEALLLLTGNDAPSVVLVRSLSPAGDAPVMLAVMLRPDFLWGSRDLLPAMTEFCVATETGITLHCSHPMPNDVISTLLAGNAQTPGATTRWEEDGEAYLASRWTLFLRGRYAATSWVVLAARPQADALRGLSSFHTAFIPAVILSTIAVGLLALSQIRRTLTPLDRLLAGTQRIAQQDFATRVHVEGKDEFGELANAFNAMSDRLGLHFSTLNAFAEIDRAILATIDLRAVASTAVHCVREIAAVDVASVALIQPASTESLITFTLAGADPASVQRDEYAADFDRVAPSDTPAGLTWMREPELPLPYRAALLTQGGARYFAFMPIVRGDRLWGWVVIGHRAPREIPKERITQLAGLADRLAVALESAARERQLHRQAHFDSLTGLPNRFYFIDMLTQELAHARREQFRVGLLFLDLDRFKQANDTLGHAAGDVLLCQAAARIKGAMRDIDRLGRLGGDEFTILLSRLGSENDAGAVAGKLIEVLSAPFHINGERVDVSASVGIAIFPNDADAVPDLLRHADTAMYRAKAQGRGRYVFFEERMNTETRARAKLHRDLCTAIDHGEFVLHYQPQLDLGTGTLRGVEALIRWQHPQRGLLSPGSFVPFADESGLIERIGAQVLRNACAQFRRWSEQGLEVGRIAVNVSSRQLHNGGFVALVKEQLRQANMVPDCLEIEITESVFMDMESPAVAALRELRALGVNVALDDFGTGYSSFGYLKTLPVSVIKIDRAFVRNVTREREAAMIAETILRLSHALGKTVVAEGIEERGQLAFLQKLGCDSIQGFLVSKPLPEDELAAFFREFSADVLARNSMTPLVKAADSSAAAARGERLGERIKSAVS